MHLKLEEDLRDLNLCLADNQRLFHSPIPPTMSRHVTRSMVLWLTGLPLVLCGTMAPLACALWVFAISYIFVGIDEVGVQARAGR